MLYPNATSGVWFRILVILHVSRNMGLKYHVKHVKETCSIILTRESLWIFVLTISSNEEADTSSQKTRRMPQEILLYIYGSFVGAVVIGNVLQALCFFTFCTKAAKNIHSKMLDGVIYSPMDFIKKTGTGTLIHKDTVHEQ